MARKRRTEEEIVAKLRRVEFLRGQGRPVAAEYNSWLGGINFGSELRVIPLA